MSYNKSIREEELKNKLRVDYFQEYDATPILGNVDFAVAVPNPIPQLKETEYFFWAESKKGNQNDIYESITQLILTIGKEKTFDSFLPPAFLGAFDSEKIAFISYNSVIDIFNQNDFNWKIAPSDHSTKEFQQVLSVVKNILDKEVLIFKFSDDSKELKRFIKKNFKIGKTKISKIQINKNNFTAIYQKWLKEVKPFIQVNWDEAKKQRIYDYNFYLADIMSDNNFSFKELFVRLKNDYYEIGLKKDEMGAFDSKTVYFKDDQIAHTKFWNRYKRPPKKEYWDYIVERQDLLVPQDIRERRGSYFTPQQWVELSQQYLAEEFGENWQDEYFIWDCAAGTGNLLNGLTNKYNIWASTIDPADVKVMKDRIRNGANLLENHVFQFDFLNDSFNNLPQSLKDIINDPELRKKLIVYINPPWGEAANAKQIRGTGDNKTDVAVKHLTYKKYINDIGIAGRELFAQFIIRIYQEIPGCKLAQFSKLKNCASSEFPTI
ncbi:MAG: hypothetical protein J1F16_01940 [Muribaculaceae bacterium]|nr:hypothetical protein [Muribaculaceae bacterium]